MDTGGFNNPKVGTFSQDTTDQQLPGTSKNDRPLIKFSTNIKPKNVPLTPKGVEQAKKRLRAFSIQKKSSLSPVSVPKSIINTGNATVFIGKATGVKTVPKPEPDPMMEPKKLPKPPKPGTKQPTESYIMSQKKTQAEIEDMKRKMELVDLGIPLGLICPPPNSDKAMPTKAMPPIKTFLDSEKVDELIREAKKAREEGREFKFDYRKLLPDYANPFQRKKDMPEAIDISKLDEHEHRKSRDKNKRSDRTHDARRHSSHKSDKDRHREDKDKDKSSEKDESHKERDKSRDDSKHKEKDYKYKEKGYKSKQKKEVIKDATKDEKEAEVDLKDFVVCDSWSDNEDKSKDSTPKPDDKKKLIEGQVKEITPAQPIDPMEQLRESLGKKDEPIESPKPKIKRLKPVMDSFKFEIEDPDEDDVIDMFDENTSLDKFSKVKLKKEVESPDMQIFDYDVAKDETFDGMADDTFLESVINEIKQEDIDETSQDKALVEYDESPSKDGEARSSVTPEMDDRVRQLHSSRSDYSDGYKSTESGYKSTDSLKISEYKSDVELERIVQERKRELERMVEDRKIDKYTADSLETWSFVLKICQPLLFRHDRNKCYKETRTSPKLWFTENPKLCNCVKDRRVVYEELEMCKMELVDNLYSKNQPLESEPTTVRNWYPPVWDMAGVGGRGSSAGPRPPPPATPERGQDLSLDKEYQRFMEAVWPDVAEPKSETPRSTPVRREKKKADDIDSDTRQKAKKMKTGSEGWSQESDIEEEVSKSYNALQDFLYEAMYYNSSSETVVRTEKEKVKPEKEKRKRKHSASTVTDSSESDAKKRKKMQKKKNNKNMKSRDVKRRRVSKKNIKKSKAKPKKKKKIIEVEEDSDMQELEKEKKKKDKRLKKKKQLKQKKKNQKKKKARAKSSSSSDSSSDSESEQERKSKKKKKNSDKKKKHKKSYDEEELFDVNILKNIKTERESDDEQLEFSPRRQKPREIINVKELQNDFVGNSIQIKKEVEQDEQKKIEKRKEVEVALAEKQEESRESVNETVKEKETVSDFKEQEESQSTPQLPPEESNHSQASSQESLYSLKDQPIYEKDESHLRPSSQNSNYSFHDVMASGMYSKNAEREKNIQLEQEMLSREHEMLSREHEMLSREHEMLSREPEMQSREQHIHKHEDETHSRDSDTRRHDDMQRRDRDIKKRERDQKSRKHETHRSEHIISHEHDSQSRTIELQTREHLIPSREHEMQSHEHTIQSHEHEMRSHEHELSSLEHEMQSHDEMQSHEMDSQEYEHGNYEIYEQMAMAYQSDVASQHTSPPDGSGSRPIETVVGARTTGEIKCDWRAGHSGAPPPAPAARPSRWGLKPGEVNIVLTGGDQYAAAAEPAPHEPHAAPEPVYQIQSIANRTDNSATGYDEAYQDMYGASDKLQYGDCFSTPAQASAGEPPAVVPVAAVAPHTSSLDARINLALRTTVLGEVAKDLEETEEKEGPEKGILVTKSLSEGRAGKRVTFADGYRPGQDSDVEEPPVRKKKARRRLGCAWPCPASHPDHVPLWDALPPPPPPPGSPPPPAPGPAPPTHLLRQGRPPPGLVPPSHVMPKFDPNTMPAFMPPEPPPGLISFQNM